MVFQDARLTQITFLGLFLWLGVSTRDWTVKPELILVVIASCLGTQWLLTAMVEYGNSTKNNQSDKSDRLDNLHNFKKIKHILISPKVLTSLRSAVITSLGLCLLLRSNSYQTIMLAGFLAIAFSTFLLQHYFYVSTAVFWSLFIISPLTVALDLIWTAPRFKWQRLTVIN